MQFLLVIIPLFFIHRYFFKKNLEKQGRASDHLSSNIAVAYITSLVVGAAVFFLTMWPFLGAAESGAGLELLSFVVWGAGFIVPLVLAMKRTGASWGSTLVITLVPVFIAIIIWNIVAQVFA